MGFMSGIESGAETLRRKELWEELACGLVSGLAALSTHSMTGVRNDRHDDH
jgi:hypothetical protein